MSAHASRRPSIRTLRLTPRRRHLAAVVTIALSTAFIAVMVLAGNLMQSVLSARVDDQLRGVDLVVSGPTDSHDVTTPIARPAVEGAAAVWPSVDHLARVTSSGSSSSSYVSFTVDAPASVVTPTLDKGRVANAPDEVVIDPSVASELQVGVGGSLTLDNQESPTGAAQTLTIVGIAAQSKAAALGGGLSAVHLSEDGGRAVLGADAMNSAPEWNVHLTSGVDPGKAATSVHGTGTVVRTAEQARARAVKQLTKGLGDLSLVLGVFVVIALITSAVVIANTFAVTLAQRTRSLALLRTLGARRGQVAGVVLRESVGVGVLGSVLGVVVGIVVVQAALVVATALGYLDGLVPVPVSVLSVVLPVVVGIAVTLLAGIAPIRSATKVAPLQALRPAEANAPVRGGLRGILSLRGIVGLIGVVLGMALMAGGLLLALGGSTGGGVVLTMLGGVISFLGVLVGLVAVTPLLSSMAGAVVSRIGGLPARVASTNTRRSPRRSAATIVALLIGTTLMTMMAVGARTADVSLTRDLANRIPVDVIVSATAMPADAAAQIGHVQGIQTAVSVPRAEIGVGARDPMAVYGASTQQLDSAANRTGLAQGLEDETVRMGEGRAEQYGLHDGQDLSVTTADGKTRQLRVQVDGNLDLSLVTSTTLRDLAGPSPQSAVLARMAPEDSSARKDTDAADIYEAITRLTSADDWQDVTVNPAGVERESYGQVLSVLLGITLALLGVAVVVALVGVANTLSLGVLERTAENSLLRALGTTRRQMRAMLGWEGILLALIGAVLGVVLGTIYGVAGVYSLLASSFPVTVSIPWLQLAALLLLSVLAGWAASVLPGRRAARTAPAQALADQG